MRGAPSTVATVATVAERKTGVVFCHLIFKEGPSFYGTLKVPEDVAFYDTLCPKTGHWIQTKSVRRTRSHRMKFCVQKGLGGTALNKQTAGNVSVY